MSLVNKHLSALSGGHVHLGGMTMVLFTLGFLR